jgi:transcriptional regulator with XRE-family HTH domain
MVLLIFDFVKQRRESLGLSQVELANRAKISVLTLKSLEGFEPHIPFDIPAINLKRLADVLGVKMNDFFEYEWP